MNHYWRGVLATFNVPGPGGTTLSPPDGPLRHGLFPLPLYSHQGEAVGSVSYAYVHANELRAEGSIYPGLLTPGRRQPVSVDVDDWLPPRSGDIYTLAQWRLVAVHLAPTAAESGFPGAHIRLKEEQ